MMLPWLRKLTLIFHVTTSVGWLGAVGVFLAVALIGLSSPNPQLVRAAYLVMAPAAWVVLVPLALTSLLTGLIQSLGTTWGLFRHYWVIFKLLINIFAVVVLLMYTRTLSYLADIAATASVASGDFGILRTPSVVLHSVLAIILLIVATTLAVYKPRGMTRYGLKSHDIS